MSIAEGIPRTLPADRELSPASKIEGRSPWALAWQRLRHDRVAIASGVVILLISLMAICAPLDRKSCWPRPQPTIPDNRPHHRRLAASTEQDLPFWD